MSTTADNYLRDLGPLILQYAREAKRGTHNSDFEAGRRIAFYAVLSLMKQQAVAFGMSDQALGLEGVDLEREAL